MIKNSSKISLFSVLGRLVRIISGPLTILIVSRFLTIEEIGVYYTFFNLIAMQQLMELGLGHTIKQYISHAHKSHDVIEQPALNKISDYFSFSMLWFFAVSIFSLVGIGFFGELFYGSLDNGIDWQGAWWFLVIVVSLTTVFLPFQFLIEGIQKQLFFYKVQFVFSLFYSLLICIFISFGLKLYSIPAAMLASNLLLYLLLLGGGWKYISEIVRYSVKNYSWADFKSTFTEIWPMLSRVSIVWGVGFLFWNGFNLIAMKTYSPEYAGKIIFSLTLARAGYSIAESILNSQMTLFAKEIASGEVLKSYSRFVTLRLYSLALLVIGYSSFVLINVLFPNFYIFKKIVDLPTLLQIFLFFLVLLILTLSNNFVRCFKIEPFVKISIAHSLMLPSVFYISSLYKSNYVFLYCTLVIFFSIIASYFVSQKYLPKTAKSE